MRILLVRNIAGTATHWRDALRELGHEAAILETFSLRFGYDVDYVISRLGASPASLRHLFSNIPFELRKWNEFDAVITNYWISPSHDLLPALISRRPNVCVLHGSDLRVRSLPNRVGRFLTSRFAKKLFVSTPDLRRYCPSAELLERPFRAPNRLAERAETRLPGSFGRIRMLHAPTERSLKGTDKVLEAVEILRREGLPFEFELLEGIPHDKLLEKMLETDIVIDLMNREFGVYGMISVEAMALGRVAVCYLDSAFYQDYAGRPPVISPDSCSGESLADALRALLIGDREELIRFGQRGKDYIREVHDPHRQARRLLSALAISHDRYELDRKDE